ncbi:MAG TPA: hypothetical protein VGX28_00535 [Frankiaceae bacterium]|nr:hypothetical protein [Frankiaceae bacterium]
MPPAPPPVTTAGSAGRVFRAHLLLLACSLAAGGALFGAYVGAVTGFVWGGVAGFLLGSLLGIVLGALHALAQAVVLPWVPAARRRAVAPRVVHVVAVLLAYALARGAVVYRFDRVSTAVAIVAAFAYAVTAAYLAHRVLPRPPGVPRAQRRVAPRHRVGPTAL